MESTKSDEHELVEKAVAGDPDAFGALYSKYMDSIYRYIYYRTGMSQDAEDLTEQVFLNAWEAIAGYKDYGNPFSSWLYRIAHNIVIDYHRRLKIQNQSLQTAYSEFGDQDSSNILNVLIENEQYRLLSAAISRLSEEHQQVIVLRFIEGLSHAEIASIIGKNEGACRMIQHRALITLTGLLSSQ